MNDIIKTRQLEDEENIIVVTSEKSLEDFLELHQKEDYFEYMGYLYTMVNYDYDGVETVFTAFDKDEDIVASYYFDEKGKRRFKELTIMDTISWRNDLVYLSRVS